MITITDITAMRLWAHEGLLDRLGNPCSAQGLSWSAASAREVWQSGLEELGIRATKADPVHVLVDAPNARLRSERVRSHVWSGRVPAGSLFLLAPGVLITSPAFCCLLAGARASLPRVAARVMECLGRYGTSEGPRGFLDRRPLITRDELLSYLDGARSCPGANKVRRALKRSIDPTRSPLETRVALTLTLPARLGGYGLPLPEANYVIVPSARDVSVSQFARYEVDLCWPSRRTLVEVDSYQFHLGPEQLDADAKKRNSLKSMGWKVTSVTSGQLAGDALEVLARQLARDLGTRLSEPSPERRDWLVSELA